MMARRPQAYQSKNGEDSMEALSAKLSADLRGNIRALGAFPLLSDEWCKMATALGRIAEISEAEAKLTQDCIEGERKTGEGKDCQKTLWEGEEMALRYVLEDGKLNVCLRNLSEWRKFHRNRRDGGGQAGEDGPLVLESLDSFEKGMGTVLRNAWTHVEALQTTDIPLLVEYVTGVYRDAADNPGAVEDMSLRGDLAGRQEIVCLSYLRGLVSRLSDYEEGRVMPHLRGAGTVSCLAAMLHANHRHLGMEAAAVGAEALAFVCDTEDFITYREEYINDAARVTFASLKEDFVQKLCEDSQERKILRPLLDAISYCRRKSSRK
ncbi:unnamed protein product [Ectocarpus sp. 12 AP-2014]